MLFNNTEILRTQPTDSDNIFGTDDEGICPLNDKFLEVMSVIKEQSDAKSTIGESRRLKIRSLLKK